MPPTKAKLAVSPEGYQQALDLSIETIRSKQLRECVRAASELLQKSQKFKDIVARLNSKYVSAVALEKLENFESDDDGVLTTGKFSGRRTLAFSDLTLTKANRFLRAGSHEMEEGSGFPLSDWILLKRPFIPDDFREEPDEKPEDAARNRDRNRSQRGKCIAELVGPIAHETVHAFNRVSAKAIAPSLSRKERVAARITEEIATREKEKEILQDLLSLSKLDPEWYSKQRKKKRTAAD